MGLLSGIRVVEMGMWIAGPSAGSILADWGAEVIKIETPAGDPTRNFYGAMWGSKETRSPPFEMYNRSKRSVVLDLTKPEGLEAARAVIRTADVFLTNLRPQYLRGVGVGHEQLLAEFPRLVYAVITGYGLEGPDKDLPGYDFSAFAARSGIVERMMPPGSPPYSLPGAMGDNVAAITIVAGIMGALWYRERHGRGQLVSTSLLRTGIFCIGMDMAAQFGLGRTAPAAPRTRPNNPLMNSYRTADDRWLWMIGAEPERHWEPTLRALDVLHLKDDPRFATTRERRRNSTALVAEFDAVMSSRTRAEWAERFTAFGVWWAPVNSPEDLLTDAQVQAVRAFVPIPSMAGDGTTMQGVTSPVDFGGAVVAEPAAPPRLGEDTTALLAEVGLDAAAIERLRAAGAIPAAPEP